MTLRITFSEVGPEDVVSVDILNGAQLTKLEPAPLDECIALIRTNTQRKFMIDQHATIVFNDLQFSDQGLNSLAHMLKTIGSHNDGVKGARITLKTVNHRLTSAQAAFLQTLSGATVRVLCLYFPALMPRGSDAHTIVASYANFLKRRDVRFLNIDVGGQLDIFIPIFVPQGGPPRDQRKRIVRDHAQPTLMKYPDMLQFAMGAIFGKPDDLEYNERCMAMIGGNNPMPCTKLGLRMHTFGIDEIEATVRACTHPEAAITLLRLDMSEPLGDEERALLVEGLSSFDSHVEAVLLTVVGGAREIVRMPHKLRTKQKGVMALMDSRTPRHRGSIADTGKRNAIGDLPQHVLRGVAGMVLVDNDRIKKAEMAEAIIRGGLPTRIVNNELQYPDGFEELEELLRLQDEEGDELADYYKGY